VIPERFRRRFVSIAFFCIALQIWSATWLVKDFDTPNASTIVARSLVARGRYAVAFGGRLWGPTSPHARDSLSYYVLPGEPLYLAASFKIVPERLHPYIHLPVTMLLLAAVTAFAAILGGPRLAVATAAVASLEPFVVVHGPVWDDTFLAAALQWSVLALLAGMLYGRWPPRSLPYPDPAATAGAAIAIGVAAVVRGDVPLFVALLALVVWRTPALLLLRGPVIYCALAAAVALTAWGARNQAVVGSFALGSSHDGITLWESNGPYTAAALQRGQVMMLSGQPDLMHAYWSDTRDMSEPEANRYFAEQAVRYVVAHPVDELLLMTRKTFYTLTAIRPELPVMSSRNLVGIVANVVTFVLAALGVGVLLRDRERARRITPLLLILLPLLVTGVLAILIGPIGMRYRIAIDGVVWIFAGMGLLRIADGWRHFDLKRSAPGA
jgi:hypothetical protein